MQLTHFTDYALRVLIYVAVRGPALSSISEVAQAHGIARPHVVKIVHALGRAGYLETTRGRGGGIRLGRPAEATNLGALVRLTEQNLAVVDCMGEGGDCAIVPACRLQGIFRTALEAFLSELDRHTLADVLGPAAKLRRLLAVPTTTTATISEPRVGAGKGRTSS
jgi:Rrf2 family nitric oxide-sensitive transcriptional repressor